MFLVLLAVVRAMAPLPEGPEQAIESAAIVEVGQLYDSAVRKQDSTPWALGKGYRGLSTSLERTGLLAPVVLQEYSVWDVEREETYDTRLVVISDVWIGN